MRKKKVPDRDAVLQQQSRLAFGSANDCVRLALEEDPPVSSLDLTLLSEIKRSKGGVVEIKLVDRLEALEQLAALLEQREQGESPLLLQLLSAGEERT